jgi:hypothetical protein
MTLNVSRRSIYSRLEAAAGGWHRHGECIAGRMGPGASRAAVPYSNDKEALMTTARFTTQEARQVAEVLGLDLGQESFDIEQFRMGMDVELEHGRRDPQTNVTNDDPVTTGKIALAHLRELPDYYTRLAVMEGESET